MSFYGGFLSFQQFFFKKSGPTPTSFLFIFVLFKHYFTEKNCRLQRDSNSDRWSRRPANWPHDHHHGPSFQQLTVNIFIIIFLSMTWFKPNLAIFKAVGQIFMVVNGQCKMPFEGSCVFLLKNGPTPASFIVYFQSFRTSIITVFTTNICDNCPSTISCQNSNPRPLERESLPINTSPGLPT